VVSLADALHEAPVTSEGLLSVGLRLQDLRRTPEFVSLQRELPALRETLGSLRSVAVGVNQGPDLSPESATILELGTQPIDEQHGISFEQLAQLLRDRQLA
jgi:hypothetical protein